MVDWTRAIVIETGNWTIAITLIVTMIWIMIRAKYSHLNTFNQRLVQSAGISVTGAALYFSWFATSRHFSPRGEEWTQAMLDYRHIAVPIFAALVLFGVSRFVWLIEGYSSLFAGLFVGCVLAVAVSLGAW